MRERTSGERFVSWVYVVSMCSGKRAARCCVRGVELVDAQPEPPGIAADLVQRGEPEVAVERGVLDALRHHRAGRLLEAHDELLVSRFLQEEHTPQLLRDVRAPDLLAVRVLDHALVRLDVGAVDVERRERERQVLRRDLLVQPPQLRLERVHGDLELRERRRCPRSGACHR